jgi:flagellar M-ring protein FliF
MIDQLQLLVRQLTTSQKIGIGFGALASVFVLVVFVFMAGQTPMQAAFTRLSTPDAAAISEALRTAKIPFQVADAGATILVPSSALADARVAAGAAGISTDGAAKGFELFDNAGFGMSEFDQQVTYQRALEGKLTGVIEAMDGVDTATVSIVMAQTGIFADQDQPAAASVVVRMRNGQPPDAAMVRGMVSSVASAVAGLTPDNVTVVDESGRLLAGPQGELAGDVLTMQGSVERQIEAKVQELVDRALGPGHASVAVSASLDMDKVDQTVTTIRPIDEGNWTPTSVQTVEERYGGADGTGSGGIPGVVSNVPGLPTYPGGLPSAAPSASPSPGASASVTPAASAAPVASPAPAASGATTGYVKSQQTVNYTNSQTVERIIKQPGAIERLSVAVLLDQAALGAVTADSLQATINAAIGADPARGDVVTVSAVAFATASAAPEASALPGDLVGTAGSAATTLFGIVVAIVLLVLVWRNLGSLRRQADAMQLAAGASPQGLLGAYTASGAGVPLGSMAELGAPQAAVGDRLRIVAGEKPDAIAGLMNDWLREDQHR